MDNITQLEDQLNLTWIKKGTYHSGISFEWRDILLHFKVDVNFSGFSRTDTITININWELSRFGVGRRLGGGGSIGNRPTIETDLNFLTIIHSENKIILKDNLKVGNLKLEEKFPFRIISIPNFVEF